MNDRVHGNAGIVAASVAGVLAVVGVILGVQLMLGDGDTDRRGQVADEATSGPTTTSATAEPTPTPSSSEPAAPAPKGATDSYGLAIGSPDAPHHVVVYEDYLCPFCGQLETATRDDLHVAAREGRAYVEYRPFNLLGSISDYSERAAAATFVVLDVSGPEVAVAYHDALYAQQPSESGPFPDNYWLIAQAVAAGADESAIRGPIERLAFGDYVAEATDAAARNGISATPTLILDDRPVTGRTIDDMAKKLRQRIA